MDKLPQKKEDFVRYHKDREIVRKTALQVAKDFATFGFDITFPDNLLMAYDELFDQLAPVIRDLIEIQSGKLYALLYTIDLSEAAIRKGTAEMGDMDLSDAVTHLILERELKKVLTREYFSRNS